jgi:hypothetical protein
MAKQGFAESTRTLVYIILAVLILIFLLWALKNRLGVIFG